MTQLNADTSFIAEYEEWHATVMKLHITLPTAWCCGLSDFWSLRELAIKQINPAENSQIL